LSPLNLLAAPRHCLNFSALRFSRAPSASTATRWQSCWKAVFIACSASTLEAFFEAAVLGDDFFMRRAKATLVPNHELSENERELRPCGCLNARAWTRRESRARAAGHEIGAEACRACVDIEL